MRLIDADALLEKVQFRNPIDNHNAEVIAGCVNLTRRIIDNSPTIDAVPVVRCKDCLKHIHEDDVDYICGRTGTYTRFDDFCSYGEKRGNDAI